MKNLAADPVEHSAIKKIAIRLVPFIALMFFINYLDRTAISFAGPNGMDHALGLTAAQFGFASGVFFIGYILLEVPSNLALHKFGARVWLARIMISWGIVALLFTWVSSIPGLYFLRFLLGVAEAGFFPGAILFLSMWVPANQRSKILSLFYLAQPLTTVLALYFWSRDATKRGVKTWHIAIPAVVGAITIPIALFMGSAAGTVAVITVTACSIFAALPSFWTIPSQFLTGAAAAAGIALINTAGNFAGFAAGYITGALKDWTGSYIVPMFLVGGFMLLSAICMVAISAQAKSVRAT